MSEDEWACVSTVDKHTHRSVEGGEGRHGCDSEDFEQQEHEKGEGEGDPANEARSQERLHEGHVSGQSREEESHCDEVEELALNDLRLTRQEPSRQAPAHRSEDREPVEEGERARPGERREGLGGLEQPAQEPRDEGSVDELGQRGDFDGSTGDDERVQGERRLLDTGVSVAEEEDDEGEEERQEKDDDADAEGEGGGSEEKKHEEENPLAEEDHFRNGKGIAHRVENAKDERAKKASRDEEERDHIRRLRKGIQ